MARAGAEVVGLDFSEGMLAVARGRLEGMGGQGLPQVKFVAGDALDLPFEAASFDAVTVAYGLRNLADLGRGLAEMARVTRPGGRLVALEFGKPANWVWRRLFFAYLGSAVPRLGRWFGGGAEAYGYILESLQHYPAQEGVVRLLEGLGLEGVRMENLMGGAMSIHVAEKRPGPS
jgi:demethylmenaquinone methyltransferase/2-methoxy-6-polyprenyl-1,4-benzoquinol methylase